MESRGRILLVDDDPDLAWNLGRYLTAAGFLVSTCADGVDAIQQMELTDFDSLVTDIKMQEINGLALLEWVRKNRPDLQSIVISSFGSKTVRNLVLKLGAAHYLEKPLDPDLLARLLQDRKDSDFTASIASIGLFDYLQLELLTRRRLVLEVCAKNNAVGRIYIDRGVIKHAECDEHSGLEAFFLCMSFKGGSFVARDWHEPAENSIDQPGDKLLMDVVEQMVQDDEGKLEDELDFL
jgi:ActR/RegA family two-component response regulator